MWDIKDYPALEISGTTTCEVLLICLLLLVVITIRIACSRFT